MNSYSELVATARNAFNREITKPLDFRVKQLKALHQLLEDHGEALLAAVQKDLQKPRFEALLVEVESVKHAIKGFVCNINEWVQPKPTLNNITLFFDKTFIYPEPYGVVLIIGAWNFPLYLIACPLLGAIAAGNCAIIKPSEKAPATAELLANLIPKYLDTECYHVVTGGAKETTELLKERFDYLFYTGSPPVGQKIREAVNKYLTPVTLELGGKSPVYIDDDVNIELACKRVIWGKMLNLGQTCVAPDYVLCSKEIEVDFIRIAKKTLVEFFGEDPKKSPDLARIVNDQHFERVLKFLKCGRIALGGSYDAKERYISPTILTDIESSDSVMQEEIFGPVLPIINVSSPDEAIEYITRREKPLTLYVFSKNKRVVNRFMISTSSGSMCVNDTMVHLSVESLPFGGVGMSGIGKYHGKCTFDTFCHKKSVLIRSFNVIGEYLGQVRYPPYNSAKAKFIKHCLANRPNLMPHFLSYILVFLLGIVTALIAKEIMNIIPLNWFE